MDYILIEERAYEEIKRRVKLLSEQVAEFEKKYNGPQVNKWLDGQDVLNILSISGRALQSYRDRGIIPYTFINRKSYYRADIIAQILAEGTIDSQK